MSQRQKEKWETPKPRYEDLQEAGKLTGKKESRRLINISYRVASQLWKNY